MKIPKKGDVVWINAWGGTLAVVRKYDRRTKTLFMSYAYTVIYGATLVGIPYCPIEPNQVKILGPKDIIKKAALISELKLATAKKSIISTAGNIC